ncbi:MAG: monovalent cation/H+ antiporter subunit D family protein [Pseudomonadota bacterium]
MIDMATLVWLAIAIPVAGAVLIVLTGRLADVREAVTMVTAILTFMVVVLLLLPVLAGERPTVILGEPIYGLPLKLTLEPLGMVFALVASLLWMVTSVYSIGYMRSNREGHQTRYYAFFAVSIASAVGIAFSGNMFTLFVFYEVLTIATYPLVTHHGNDEARRGGRTYLGILLGTSIAFQLLAIIWTWVATGTLDFRDGGILSGHVAGPALIVLLLLYMYGIGKAALMPLHRWLPAAMVAPTPVSALLHAVAVVKAGVFTVLKVILYIFGIDLLAETSGSEILVWLAGITIIVGSLVALRQDNIKRRLAYSTVSQLSYVVLGAAILAPISVAGAIIHIAAHAFGKITLFFVAGSIYTAAHKTLVSELDGIGRRMPWTMAAFAVGSLSMIGLPPTFGFVSKWYMLQGAMQTEQFIPVAVIVVSTLLNAAYFLPILFQAYFKPPPEGSEEHGEAPILMLGALLFTAACTIIFFFAPGIPGILAFMAVGSGG